MAKVDELHELLENMINKTKASTGAIWNSFEELEEESLAKLRAEFGIPIFPVGTLLKYCSTRRPASQSRIKVAWTGCTNSHPCQ